MSMEQMMSQLGDFQEKQEESGAPAGGLDSFLGIGGLTGLSGLGQQPNNATGVNGQNPGNRILISNIPADLKEDDVRIYFEGFGKLCDFFMPAQRDGSHMGMAFLSFNDNVDKELVSQNSPHVIGGYEVVIDDAKPKSGSPPTCNYYDWGEWGSSSVDLTKLASAGYVAGDATTPASASDWSNWQEGSPSAPPPLGVASAPSKATWSKATNKGDAAWGKGAWGSPSKDWGKDSWGTAGSVKGGKTSMSTTSMNERQHRVFVTRIAEDLTKEDLEAYFTQFGELTDIFVPLRNPNADPQDGMHKGIAFVSFKEKDTYEEVLSRDKYEIKPDVFIVVDKAAGKESRKGKDKKGGDGGKWGAGSKGKGKYGKWDDWMGGGDWSTPSWDDWGYGGKKGGSWGPY